MKVSVDDAFLRTDAAAAFGAEITISSRWGTWTPHRCLEMVGIAARLTMNGQLPAIQAVSFPLDPPLKFERPSGHTIEFDVDPADEIERGRLRAEVLATTRYPPYADRYVPSQLEQVDYGKYRVVIRSGKR